MLKCCLIIFSLIHFFSSNLFSEDVKIIFQLESEYKEALSLKKNPSNQDIVYSKYEEIYSIYTENNKKGLYYTTNYEHRNREDQRRSADIGDVDQIKCIINPSIECHKLLKEKKEKEIRHYCEIKIIEPSTYNIIKLSKFYENILLLNLDNKYGLIYKSNIIINPQPYAINKIISFPEKLLIKYNNQYYWLNKINMKLIQIDNSIGSIYSDEKFSEGIKSFTDKIFIAKRFSNDNNSIIILQFYNQSIEAKLSSIVIIISISIIYIIIFLLYNKFELRYSLINISNKLLIIHTIIIMLLSLSIFCISSLLILWKIESLLFISILFSILLIFVVLINFISIKENRKVFWN